MGTILYEPTTGKPHDSEESSCVLSTHGQFVIIKHLQKQNLICLGGDEILDASVLDFR